MRPRSSRPPTPATESLAGKRVTVVGLGHFGGGLGLTRWLCKQGAKVTVSDRAPAEELAAPVGALAGLDVTLHLGGHLEDDFCCTDLLVVNPAVPKDMPLLAGAREAGVPRTSEINLFLQRCRAPVVGVTGSVGKSTTTAMVGKIIARHFTTHVGGNIGRSLLEDLPAIQSDHVVALELSSFQLEDLPLIGVSPHVAVVTNLMPNHLERHGTMEAYAAAKKNIFRFQSDDDVLVLNASCAETADWPDEAPGKVTFFNPQAEAFKLSVLGAHNQANAQAAWTAAEEFGIDRETAAKALREFAGLPHRLQFVYERGGVRYYNDSKCTTPAGAIVAVESFPPRRVAIIVGGYDKGVMFDELGSVLAARAKAVIALGETRAKIVQAVRERLSGDVPAIIEVDSLASAVRQAQRLAAPGDVVLLSPACASYDMFTNYEHRGEAFVELVKNKS